MVNPTQASAPQVAQLPLPSETASSAAFPAFDVEADLPQPVVARDIDPMDSTASNGVTLAGIGGLAAATCGAVCIGTAAAGIGALGGYLNGLIGGEVLDLFDVPAEFQGLGDLAGEQGAVGNAVIFGAFGAAVGCISGAAASLAAKAEAGAASTAGAGLASTLVMSAAGNALGNVIFAADGLDHTTQIAGLAAVGTGTATVAVASAAAGIAICAGAVFVACLGATAAVIAN